MKIVSPDQIPMQQLRYVRRNGSEAANVKQLMRAMDRETNIMRGGEKIINNAESFPNRIAHSNSSMVRKLLDIV